TVEVTVDRTEALENGFSEMQLLGMVSGILSPQSVGTVTLDDQDLKIYVEAGSAPETIAELRELEVPTATGMVHLDELADVDEVNVPTCKAREDGELVATVSITPAEGQLGPVSDEFQHRLYTLDLPQCSEASIGGVAEMQQDSFQQL